MDEATKKKIVTSAVANVGLTDFIKQLQGFSLGLRHEHWETKNYARHKAVEMTQEQLDGLIDDFVEAALGSAGGARPSFIADVKASNDCGAVAQLLCDFKSKDTDLLNIRDEMLAAVHKLDYLKTLS